MNIRDSIAELQDEISSYRRLLHENPQTAYEETFANGLVCDKLSEWGIAFESGVGKTGVVATIEGKSTLSGKAIGLRADMDALDITEADNKPWVSKTLGKMHACGHDGHSAMLLGAAKYLNNTRNFNGKVHLIFQPAEEGHKGAQAMMADGLFDRYPCDQIFGMHNWPQLPRGTCAMRTGPIMASADIFYITIQGAGGHAAMPHKCVDPIVVGAQIVSALQTLVSRAVPPTEPAVVSITYFSAGEGAHNIIPDTARLIGTVRTYHEDIRHMLRDRIHSTAQDIAQAMGARVDYEYDLVLDPTINDPQATAFCGDVAKGIFGDHNVNMDVAPSMGGEDFGAMLLHTPGCYIWIGQGEPQEADSNHNHGLHTPRYDFNDAILPMGIEYWARLVETKLKL